MRADTISPRRQFPGRAAASFQPVDNSSPIVPPEQPHPRSSGTESDHPAYRHLLARQNATHLSELTLGLLHKFNSLFTGVTFLIEECLTREQAGEPVAERLREIAATLREAHVYVNRVTDLHSDEEEDDAGYYDLDAVIADRLDLARLLLPRGAALTYFPAEERLSFYASRRAVEEIILHVVGNAGEALPQRGGAVTITSRLDARQSSRVTIEIRDNGSGFAPEALDRLFVSLGTTKKERRHAGLGLLRCRQLADSFGGDLSAENHPDGGAVVTLTLPRDCSACAS